MQRSNEPFAAPQAAASPLQVWCVIAQWLPAERAETCVCSGMLSLAAVQQMHIVGLPVVLASRTGDDTDKRDARLGCVADARTMRMSELPCRDDALGSEPSTSRCLLPGAHDHYAWLALVSFDPRLCLVASYGTRLDFTFGVANDAPLRIGALRPRIDNDAAHSRAHRSIYSGGCAARYTAFLVDEADSDGDFFLLAPHLRVYPFHAVAGCAGE